MQATSIKWTTPVAEPRILPIRRLSLYPECDRVSLSVVSITSAKTDELCPSVFVGPAVWQCRGLFYSLRFQNFRWYIVLYDFDTTALEYSFKSWASFLGPGLDSNWQGFGQSWSWGVCDNGSLERSWQNAIWASWNRAYTWDVLVMMYTCVLSSAEVRKLGDKQTLLAMSLTKFNSFRLFYQCLSFIVVPECVQCKLLILICRYGCTILLLVSKQGVEILVLNSSF